MSTPTEPAQPPAQPEPHDDMEGDPTPVRRPVRKTFPDLHRRPRPAEPAPVEPALVAQPATRNRTPRRRPRITPPTQEELDALPVEKRQELHDAHRQRPWQHLTSLGVLFGVLFTAGGLYYTGQTWQTGQEALKATQQQQITDRYTKAVDQLGSAKQDVRLGGIYALQRLAADSPRDKDTIRNVLAAFVRGHDLCTVPPGRKKPPKQCTTTALADIPVTRPKADVLAALTIAPTLATPRASGGAPYLADFSRTRFPYADLIDADLRGANLGGADLSSADLMDADLGGANLGSATLHRADLGRANLIGAYLINADLRNANLHSADLRHANLSGAYLSSATLSGADLSSADLGYAELIGAYLSGADLRRADLLGADLGGADLSSADLRGADLREVTGKTAAEIKAVAITDDKTKF